MSHDSNWKRYVLSPKKCYVDYRIRNILSSFPNRKWFLYYAKSKSFNKKIFNTTDELRKWIEHEDVYNYRNEDYHHRNVIFLVSFDNLNLEKEFDRFIDNNVNTIFVANDICLYCLIKSFSPLFAVFNICNQFPYCSFVSWFWNNTLININNFISCDKILFNEKRLDCTYGIESSLVDNTIVNAKQLILWQNHQDVETIVDKINILNEGKGILFFGFDLDGWKYIRWPYDCQKKYSLISLIQHSLVDNLSSCLPDKYSATNYYLYKTNSKKLLTEVIKASIFHDEFDPIFLPDNVSLDQALVIGNFIMNESHDWDNYKVLSFVPWLVFCNRITSIDTMTISIFADNISGIFGDVLFNKEHWLG
jgi:hypothetical protein